MAEIRCPNCGKNNPDLLDVCQFCQANLKPESVLRIGETPTKKHTGELESVLPDWLKDVRQQARSSAEEEAAQAAAAQPKPPKDEPLDFLAGLASQSRASDDEEVPDWLASLNPEAKPTPPAAFAHEPSTDLLSRINQTEPKAEPVDEPAQEEIAPWMRGGTEQPTPPAQKDELSEWFTRASAQPEKAFELDSNPDQPGEADWGASPASPLTPSEEPTPKEPEDLSWLYNLEAEAKKTGELPARAQDKDWSADFELPASSSQTSGSQADLSWLDNLGGIEEPAQETPQPPAASQPDDLSWLNQFSGISEPAQESQAPTPQEDLSWLNNLGAPSESAQEAGAVPAADEPISAKPIDEGLSWLNQPGEAPEPSQPAQPLRAAPELPVSDEDLSWLNSLGKAPETSSASTSKDDLSWLNELGGASEPLAAPPFAQEQPEQGGVHPRQTAPLSQKAAEEAEPDWLKRATERPSMPAPGDVSMDWFRSVSQPAEEKPVPPGDAAPPMPQAVPFSGDIFSVPEEPSQLSNQDVDSLFSEQMPDWLSQPEPGSPEPAAQQTGALPVEGDQSLAPVDLPSWVQAMRPVEAVISEPTPRVEDQPEETEGPLAGLHGVIPMAPIGSAKRPKPVSLKLQASAEQQASAALLEQILGSETSPRTLVTSTVVASQQWLRWALAALFLVVLSAMILLRSQTIPVATSLPLEAGSISNVVMSIPPGARVLVVIDYEPALAGEMEAIGGPLLNQMALLSQPQLSFISTSPNGPALAERLLSNAGISHAGVQALNLGYLPAGSAGVLGFLEAPSQIMPLAGVQSFSEYSTLIILSDHAESGRVWVEQLQSRKQLDPALTNQPLLMVASAQAGPLLQPYASSGQITGLISGLAESARFEASNNRPGIARSYWDTFGTGLMLSVAVILIGSLWSLFMGRRAGRATIEQG